MPSIWENWSPCTRLHLSVIHWLLFFFHPANVFANTKSKEMLENNLWARAGLPGWMISITSKSLLELSQERWFLTHRGLRGTQSLQGPACVCIWTLTWVSLVTPGTDSSDNKPAILKLQCCLRGLFALKTCFISRSWMYGTTTMCLKLKTRSHNHMTPALRWTPVRCTIIKKTQTGKWVPEMIEIHSIFPSINGINKPKKIILCHVNGRKNTPKISK